METTVTWTGLIVTVVAAVLGSSGLFTLIQFLISRHDKKNDKTEELIEKRMSVQNGRTREELVAQLKSEGIITEDTPTNICNEEIVIEKSEEERLEIESYVDQLYGATAGRTGSSDGQFRKILMDSNLSDEEIVSIVKRYNEKYGSMVQDIDQDFSWMSGESEYMGRIAQALINEAQKGNEDALFYLTTEVHNATAGYDSATADSFMQQVFNKIDDTTLKHLANLYQTKYQNDLTLAIMNDFSWATNESWYLDKINNARKNG